MKTILKEYNVYEIVELKEVSETAYEAAIENTTQYVMQDIMEFDWEDYKDSLIAFLESFDLKITDFNVGLFQPSYITTNADDYRELHDEFEIRGHVKELNGMIENVEKMNLTGVWTDSIIFSYFNDGKEVVLVTCNDISEHLNNISRWSLTEFKKRVEYSLLDENYIIDYAQNQEWYFNETGEIDFSVSN